MTPDWITAPRICERLGISRWTWIRWVRDGRAPAPIAGVPGFKKWKRIDIDRFAAGTFRSAGKRTYFTKALRLRNEQAVQRAAERATETADEARDLAFGARG